MCGVQAARLIGLLVLLVGGAVEARASVTYEYEGNFFNAFDNDQSPPDGDTYDAGDRLTIILEFASAFAADFVGSDVSGLVLDYSVSDGVHVLHSGNSSLVAPLAITFDDQGRLSRWNVVAETPGTMAVGEQQSRIQSRFDSDQMDSGQLLECWAFRATMGGCQDRTDEGSRLDDPGSWTLVPEPGTAGLLGLGLLALAARRTRGR